MKEVALSSVARLIVIIFQLINVKIYTNYLNAEQLGIYFFLLAVSYSANALLFVPVDYYQQANLSKIIANAGGAKPLLRFNIKLVFLYVCCSLFVVAAFALVRSDYLLHVVLVVALSIFMYATQALRNTLNNLEHRNCVSISFIQEACIRVLIFLMLVYFFKADESLLIVSWIVALGASGSYLYFRANKFKIFTGANEVLIEVKEVFKFSYPFSIGAACNWLQLQGYRLVLVPLGFAEEVGVFATLSSIGSAAIGAVSLVYSQQFTPLIYKSSGQFTVKYMKGALAVIVAVALVSTVLGEYVVRVLTNPSFEQHWKLILFGVITDGSNLIIGALVIYITLTGKTKIMMSSSAVGLLVTIFCFGLIYIFSALSIFSIGIPLLISQWIVALYLYVCLYKK